MKKKLFIKQVITGIVGFLITAGIFVYIMGFTDILDGNKWGGYIAITVTVSAVFGFLLYIFGGKELFFWGAKLGFGFVAFMVFVQELPQPFSGILIAVIIIAFMLLPKIKEYLSENRKPSEKRQKQIDEQHEIVTQLENEGQVMKFSIGFGEKSLLLFAPMGAIYQAVKGVNAYYFFRVGGELRGIDQDILKTDFTNEIDWELDKKDYVINTNDIDSISLNQKRSANCPFSQSGRLRIKLKNGKKSFVIMDEIDIQSICNFFDSHPVEVKKAKESVENAENPLSENDKKALSYLKPICLLLYALSVAAPALFLFVDFNYKLLSSACLLLPLVIFILYIKYNHILSFDDAENQEKPKHRIRMELPMIFPGIGLALRSLFDFNLIEYGMFILWSIVIFTILLSAFFFFTKEYKTKKSIIAVIIIAMIFYAPSSAVQINYLLDFSKPEIYSTNIIEKHISESSDSPDDYIFTVILKNGKEKELSVSKNFYQKVEEGQPVEVAEKTGFLRIKYAYVIEN